MKHTMVVGDRSPARVPAGTSGDGRTVWAYRADELVRLVRCVECDCEVGEVHDYTETLTLRAWWTPATHRSIPVSGVYGYSFDERYPTILLSTMVPYLVAILRDCHEVQMDALHTPKPRGRRVA